MTSFAYPGLDMIAAMGTARSSDMESLCKHGWIITGTVLVICLIFSVLFA